MAVSERIIRGSSPSREQFAEGLTAVIDVFSRHGVDARLAGSYGRAASVHGEPPPLYTDNSSELRDIDLMVVHHDGINHSLDAIRQEAEAVTDSPVTIDILRKNSLFSDEGTAQLSYRDVTVAVDPEALSMREGRIYDISVPTFDPMTHLHLTAVHGHMRKKDLRNLVAFGRQVRQFPSLPDEMFEPFHDLYRQIGSTYPLEKPFFAATEWYRDHLPYEMRRKLVPIMKPIRGFFLPRH